ncbi:MAG: hypothetical protein QMD95_02125 [Candidatus Hodarchaeaceae archaeon]|nr:hypothetical protein [Candidatus Hodarchaeaceae archaeon]
MIGLIGGIFVFAGIFSPWVSVSGSLTHEGQSASFTVDASGWDLTQGKVVIGGEIAGTIQLVVMDIGDMWCPYVALAGGVLALIGILVTLASTRLWTLGVLLPVGGMLAIIGAALSFRDIQTGTVTVMGITARSGYGYGIYLSIVGGILSIIGARGLRREKAPPPAPPTPKRPTLPTLKGKIGKAINEVFPGLVKLKRNPLYFIFLIIGLYLAGVFFIGVVARVPIDFTIIFWFIPVILISIMFALAWWATG